MVYSTRDFKHDFHNDWCSGCGDFGILSSITKALVDMNLAPHDMVMFSGIGCSGKTPHFINTYGIHTLHGRGLPHALGGKLANPNLEVIAVGGDGDGYGIGAGHFVNAGRRNIDIAYVVFNNEVYGLTKGQASPTLGKGLKPKSIPTPNINESINPISLAITSGYTFIARAYAYDVKGTAEIISQAMAHKGMALVDIAQPCPTYNNLHTKEWFTPRVKKIDESYDGIVKDPNDREEVIEKKVNAFKYAESLTEDDVPVGIIYKIDLPTYEERIKANHPEMKLTSPATDEIYDPVTGKPTTDVTKLIESFKV